MRAKHLNKKKPVVISIVATRSDTGKTTLIEGLIKVLKDRNYTIGVLKHDAHKFEIDKEGKDSYRFSKAGADNVIISSSEKLAMIKIVKEQVELEEIIRFFDDLDIVLIEGYKNNKYPKIEVHRKGVDSKLLCEDSNFDISTFIAVASDEDLDLSLPVIDLNDINSIACFIEDRFMKFYKD
ncbi:MAG: molybdopterin-guanine dinucleotide biosynthesis protein B [Clostridiaceae bacterium]